MMMEEELQLSPKNSSVGYIPYIKKGLIFVRRFRNRVLQM